MELMSTKELLHNAMVLVMRIDKDIAISSSCSVFQLLGGVEMTAMGSAPTFMDSQRRGAVEAISARGLGAVVRCRSWMPERSIVFINEDYKRDVLPLLPAQLHAREMANSVNIVQYDGVFCVFVEFAYGLLDLIVLRDSSSLTCLRAYSGGMQVSHHSYVLSGRDGDLYKEPKASLALASRVYSATTWTSSFIHAKFSIPSEGPQEHLMELLKMKHMSRLTCHCPRNGAGEISLSQPGIETFASYHYSQLSNPRHNLTIDINLFERFTLTYVRYLDSTAFPCYMLVSRAMNLQSRIEIRLHTAMKGQRDLRVCTLDSGNGVEAFTSPRNVLQQKHYDCSLQSLLSDEDTRHEEPVAARLLLSLSRRSKVLHALDRRQKHRCA
ncbi:hypothetical protein SELMODRAFT_420039 [Selaginella moellendorffii]|uniref:Uncharacterized protein n=1 Tax=Selaginella moellendorffii TaxID=88036 RepID=D8SAC7_SELML|nr:hypothetical protein SELMODRAFT_420039 [Selaginella moellendorffii]